MDWTRVPPLFNVLMLTLLVAKQYFASASIIHIHLLDTIYILIRCFLKWTYTPKKDKLCLRGGWKYDNTFTFLLPLRCTAIAVNNWWGRGSAFSPPPLQSSLISGRHLYPGAPRAATHRDIASLCPPQPLFVTWPATYLLADHPLSHHELRQSILFVLQGCRRW